jgi:hypothetical protein
MFGIEAVSGYRDTCMVRKHGLCIGRRFTLSAWALYGLAVGIGHGHTTAFDIGCI